MFIRKLNSYSKTQFFSLGFFILVSSLIITATLLSVVIASKANDFLPADDFYQKNFYGDTPNEYSLNYTLIEHYLSGETKVREINSLDSESVDYSIAEISVSEPEGTRTLGGSDELVILDNNIVQSPLKSKLYHVEDSEEIFDSGYLAGLDLSENLANNLFHGGKNVLGDIAVGDVDGNFREEVIVVYANNRKLVIQVLEKWPYSTFKIVANGSAGAMDYNFANVVSGNFDNDSKDEFAAIVTRASGPQLMVYDDLFGSTPDAEIVSYGDTFIFKTYHGINSFIFSPPSPDNILYYNHIPSLGISSEIKFTILNADNQSFTGPVEYGDEVLLRDMEGRYWITNNLSRSVTIADFDLNTHSLTDYTFRIISERPGGETVGVVYFNGFMGFQSNLTEEYVKAEAAGIYGLTDNKDQESVWFKGYSAAHNRPDNYYTSADPEYTIYSSGFTPNLGAFDNLARTNSQDLDSHIRPSNLAVGDVDGDRMDEILVIAMDGTSTLHAWVLDDILNGFQELHKFSWSDTNLNPSLTTGDIDGDLRDEIIFSITKTASGRIEVYDDNVSSFNQMIVIPSIDDSLYGVISEIGAGDIDGDSMDEIFQVNGSCFINIYDNNFTRIASLNGRRLKEGIPHINYYWPTDITAGDINLDGSADIIVSSIEASAWNLESSLGIGWVCLYSFNSTANDFNQKAIDLYSQESGAPHPDVLKGITGDFSADQFVVSYLEHKTWTAEEQIVCVMSAPPTHNGLSQNYDESGTEYGYSVSGGTSGSVGASIGVGAYVAYEKELESTFFFSIKIAKFEAEASLMAKVGVSRSKSFVQVKTSAFAGDGSYDYVIFTAIRYDRFIYRVISAPDSSLEGENMSALFPQEVKLYKWDREYYNSQNSENAEDIGNDILGHTIGDVTTYPTYEELASTYSERMESNIMPVGKGAGTTIVELAFSTEVEFEIETELEFEWKVGAGVGDFTFGLMGSIGAQMGWGWSWGEETSFVGEVGDIEEADDYQVFSYDYGLFVGLRHYTPKTHKEYEPDGVLGVADDVLEFLGTLSSLHMDEFDRGHGYYVIGYWVSTPEYFGFTIQEEIDYASDIDHVITEFEIPGFTLLSLLPLTLFGVRKKNTTKDKEK